VPRLTGLLFGFLGVAVLFSVASAGPAAAHAVLLSTQPASGATLAAAPRSVALTFDEAPQKQFSTIHVTGPDGQRHDSGSVQLTGAAGAVATQQLTGTGLPGRYVVDWRVVSDDGHPVSGQFTFTVSRTTQVVPSQGASAPTSPGMSAPFSASLTIVQDRGSKGGSNVGLIAGIVAAVVLIVGNIAWLAFRRRRSSVHE